MPFTPPPNTPNFNPGNGSRLVTDRYDFEAHLEGTNPPYASNFRHKANQVDMSPLVTISGQQPTNVQAAIALLAEAAAPFLEPATTTSLGIVQLSGDISGTATNVKVVSIQGNPISTLPPSVGQVLTWQGSFWAPQIGGSGPPSGLAGGDLSGTYPNPTVAKINTASVPAAGSLTTGNMLQVSGGSSLTYAPVNLAGGANYVTGVLPISNQANQTMGGDVTGTTAAATVVALRGKSLDVSLASLGATQDGYVLTWVNGSSDWQAKPSTGGGGGGSVGSFVSVSGTYTLDATSGPNSVVWFNTSGGAGTLNLPAPSVRTPATTIWDSAQSFDTHNLTINPHGLELINGSNTPLVISAKGSMLNITSDGANWLIR